MHAMDMVITKVILYRPVCTGLTVSLSLSVVAYLYLTESLSLSVVA